MVLVPTTMSFLASRWGLDSSNMRLSMKQVILSHTKNGLTFFGSVSNWRNPAIRKKLCSLFIFLLEMSLVIVTEPLLEMVPDTYITIMVVSEYYTTNIMPYYIILILNL